MSGKKKCRQECRIHKEKKNEKDFTVEWQKTRNPRVGSSHLSATRADEETFSQVLSSFFINICIFTSNVTDRQKKKRKKDFSLILKIKRTNMAHI